MIEILFLFVLFIKHAFADMFTQTYIKQPFTKLKYFDNGHRHYLHHGLSNFVVCLFFVSPTWAIIYSVFDYIAHWHIVRPISPMMKNVTSPNFNSAIENHLPGQE